ncbi:thiamine pyrophosphate-dependent enzyme [Nocardiopsis ansamitocini]|uniref:Transketolase n=1 Tax=Nocardiopsis ansamitocini TaxID=1670832 RepID=A0A9W6UKL4_9ACTN|nr:thiamine pyrophosphate-dependent enzyme [Nocardiopsis ansamitocini]GLU50104.1 transketolase [Nocardiopsis ansamitocini]
MRPTVRTARGYDDLPALLTLMTGDEKHDASATSTLEAIWVLYDRVLRVDPARPDAPERDRFLLSKGHGPMAYYAVLAAKGFIGPDDLRDFGSLDSILGYHPDRVLVPGVEIGSGSLGHGLGLAVGTALGLRTTGHPDARVVVMTGDAELEEGSNIEAIQYAARAGLHRLTAVVIDNSSASLGWPGGIASRFAVEGWSTVDVDGRDPIALERAFTTAPGDRPHAVVAHVEPKDS